jgi:ABC-type transport system involved in multi-copper enzyme maturation permease subunit
MPIREKGYYKWDGEFKKSYVKWLPIFINGIKSVFKKKKSKLLFSFAAFPFFVFLLAVYISTKPELRMMKDLVKQIQSDAMLFYSFYTFGPLIFSMILLSLFAGADLISVDLKFHSFTLYLSRPLTRFDYIKGKFSIVLFYLLLFSLIPGILLIIAKIIFSGEFSVPLYVFLSALIFPIIISLFLSSFILMVSSLSSNRKFVIIIFFVLYILSNTIAGIFQGVFKNDYFLFFSIEKNIKQFGSLVFNIKPDFDAPTWISAIILLFITFFFITILTVRIKRAED